MVLYFRRLVGFELRTGSDYQEHRLAADVTWWRLSQTTLLHCMPRWGGRKAHMTRARISGSSSPRLPLTRTPYLPSLSCQ